jgi:histidine phosphotransferase ChpT
LSDTKILELLASKICHDLISPVGAIGNGVEFLEESSGDAEAVSLIAFSAAQAAAKLKVFRMAYGAGGADAGIKPEEVHVTFEDLIKADKKVKQNWNPNAKLGPDERPAGFAKVLMCSLLLAHDSLPKGGTITVLPGKGSQVLVVAEGERAHPKDGTPKALAHDVGPDQLEPKTIHPYVTTLIAKDYDVKVSIAESVEGRVVFAIDFA